MKKFITVCCTALALLLIGTSVTALTVEAAPKNYTDYITISENGSGLMLEPTLVFEPSSFSEISQAAGSQKKPASIVLTPDTGMNVTLGSDTKTLAQAFDDYIKGKFIPVVRLDTTTVTPFISWLKNTYNVYDIMAISKDIGVIEKLYADSTAYAVNTVYDLTDETLGTGRYEQWKNIGAANKAGCNILLYSVQSNLPVVAEYVEAMAKVCWAVADSKEEAVEAMAAGCYGVVSNELPAMTEALSVFEKSGFARAQYVAAHRGITAYCNEQSKTAIAATANEGATHIELDIQITEDKQILICHNSGTGTTATGSAYFALTKSDALRQMYLKDYSRKYEDTFPTLEESIELLIDTDVIFIIELKLDAGSTLAVDKLQAIETLKKVMDKYPAMQGRWIAITFYAPYAEKMKEVLPEIPVGFLGAATSGKESDQKVSGWGGWVTRGNLPNCMRNVLRKYNVSLDEMTYDNGDTVKEEDRLSPVTNNMSASYLARGYAQNTWTFENLLHYTVKANIATTNAAEECAMVVKTIGAPASLTEAQLNAGKVKLTCTTYNGWKVERECEIIVVSKEGNKAKVLFYLEQKSEDGADITFGLYSNLTEITVA